VQSDGESINAMTRNAKQISRKTFLAQVDRGSLRGVEHRLGYAKHYRQGLTAAGDYHLAYYRSVYRGRPCVYLVNSHIEYIFCPARAQG
jgi:hypothetical protein